MMKRRSILSLSVLLIPLAGCASESSPDSSEDIFIELRNEGPTEVTVMISIAIDDSVVLEDKMSVDPDNTEKVYSTISETGDYTLTISLNDGREQEFPFNVEDYDLRNGSNISVWIDDTDIRIGIEE